MTELEIDWHLDAETVVGGCAVLPHAMALIVPTHWGKCALRVYSHGEMKHDREFSNVDDAKEAAGMVMRLLMIREAV
jgi:hypothetical protein